MTTITEAAEQPQATAAPELPKRAAFEAWAKNTGHPFHDREPVGCVEGSVDRYSEMAWEAFKQGAALAAREPMTDAEALQLFHGMPRSFSAVDFVRLVERHHGITAPAQKGGAA